MMLVMVVLLTVRGYLRGTVAQVFVVVGLVFGFYAALAISRWIGEHWDGAKPAGVYLVLRWMVAALVGLALATAFRWWGSTMAKAVRDGPLGWLDRGGGMLIGAALGTVVCTLGLLGALQFEHPKGPGMAAAQARVGASTMGAAAAVCTAGEPFLPGLGWLKDQFLAAQQRAVRMRADGVSTASH
ncbi:MAG: CvpA family protein [Candidatus Eiseniibacteriota bacterium]